MPASLNLSHPKESGINAYQMRRILLAHDNSYAAQQALEDAESFAHRFHAEIILVRVEATAEEFSSSAMASQRKEDASELDTLAKCLTAKGIANRAVLRTGTVGDTLFHIAHQEKADLLMLGAYGRGSQDRQALGSTAEHLLRSIPCPVLTYGPHATAGLMHRMTAVPSLLVAIPLPFSFAWLEPALQFAHLFGLAIELVHVTESPAAHTDNGGYREQCDTLAQQIRQKGIAAGWTIFVGVPAIFSSCMRGRARESADRATPAAQGSPFFHHLRQCRRAGHSLLDSAGAFLPHRLRMRRMPQHDEET